MTMEPGVLTKVLNDFFTTVDGELSLSTGDYFLIHNVIDKHWCYGESSSKRGRFPSNHLHKVDIPEITSAEVLFISIAAFSGEQSGDLTFGKGEVIIGEQEIDADWYCGRTDYARGIFPVSYTWLINPSILKKPTDKKTVRKKARVKTSLQAQLDEELDLTEGETITVLEILSDGWVLATTEDGRKGTCPEAFISYIEDCVDTIFTAAMDPLPPSTANGPIYKDFGYSVPNPHYEEPAPSYYDLFPERAPRDEKASPESEGDNPLGVNPYAITLYPFNAQFSNELNFEAGEVVHLRRHIDSEWAEGDLNGESGIFPTSYVNIIVNCPEVTTEPSPSNVELPRDHAPLSHGNIVRVEFTFNAQMSGDLSVTEGELVTVVDTANADWVSVRTEQGDVGLCPRGYLSEQPLPSANDDDDFVVLREHKTSESEERPKRLSEPHRPAPPAPAPGSIPLQKQTVTEKASSLAEPDPPTCEDAEQKRADKRQNVISELVLTEKEYVRDLKATYETFNLYSPENLESRGVDVSQLFGNILEVIHVAEELLDLILRAMKGCDEREQQISPCFLKMADKMQSVYGKYCSNYENALALLKKYEQNKEIMTVFDKGIETLRHQVACFDMSSILIKPMQRILKYPLMLYELIKCTEDDHPDKPGIEEAWKAMTGVASHINEYKRRKDLISKYLDSDNTLIAKMSKLNMHSVAKMSSRLSAKLSATLGYTNIVPDAAFDELERQFKAIEKCACQLASDIEQCFTHLHEETACCELLSDYLNQYHYGVSDGDVRKFNESRVAISSQYLKSFEEIIDKQVNQPLGLLLNLMDGPTTLITKRHDKLLDYDNAISRSEKYKDSRVVQDELLTTKQNYEALNQQLLEELPILIDAATKIICTCLGAFTNARKLFNGKIMKRYLNLSETTTQVSSEDILQSFLVTHNLLWNQISRFSFGGVNPRVEEASVDISPQSAKDKVMLINHQPHDRLFVVKEDLISTSILDLGVMKGTILAVIKKQDPMGDSSRWFVDDGKTQGFVPSDCLEPLPLPRSAQINCDVVDSRASTPDLMCLDSPVKEVKSDRLAADLAVRASSPNSQALYSNVGNNVNSQHNQNYENIPSGQSRYQNLDVKFYYAEYNFDGTMPGTLAVKRGQVLKLVRPCDDKRNSAWWLMEDRDAKTGYVPSNYLQVLPESS